MPMPPPEEQIVKEGSFVYAESVQCEIRIVRTNVRFGSGDADDPPEVSEDRVTESYYVQYGSTTQRGVFTAGSGPFDSLPEALAGAARQLGAQRTIRWEQAQGE
jgi:hypothetical protein